MKTDVLNKDCVIVYDADCPMCRWYTGQFVAHDLLPENGREPYQKIGPFVKTKIDMDRARNHIALLNKKTGEVQYGLQSLVTILGSRWHWIKTVAAQSILAKFLSGLYNFISFNRKAIAPAAQRGYLDCVPDKNWLWRNVFVVCCMLLVEFTAGMYFSRWFSGQTLFGNVPFRESILFVAQLLFQLVALRLTKEKNIYEYLGQLSMVSLLGGLLLLPAHWFLMVLAQWNVKTDFLSAALLGAVITFMFFEHKRRIKLIGLKPMLSYSWVLFRILLFFIIFKS